MTKKISILVLVVFVLSLIGLPYALAATPIAQYNYEEAVNVLADLGIIYNISKDYKLDSYATRAELAQIATTLIGVSEDDIIKNYLDEEPYKDTVDHPLKGYIAFVKNKNIMQGRNSNTFAPDAPTTVEEAATVLVKLLGANVPNGKWPYNYLKVAYDLHIIPNSFKLGKLYKKDLYLLVYNTLMVDKTNLPNTQILQQIKVEQGIITAAPKYDDKFVINTNEYPVSTDKDISSLIGQRVKVYLVKRNVKDANSKWEVIDVKPFEGVNDVINVTLENPNDEAIASKVVFTQDNIKVEKELNNATVIINNVRLNEVKNADLENAYVSLISNDGDPSTIEYVVGVKYNKLVVKKAETKTLKNEKGEEIEATVVEGFDLETGKEISLRTKDLMPIDAADFYNYTINNGIIDELYVAEERIAGTVDAVLDGRIFMRDENGTPMSFIISPSLIVYSAKDNYKALKLNSIKPGAQIVGYVVNGILRYSILK